MGEYWMAQHQRWLVAIAGVAIGWLIVGCATKYKPTGGISGGYCDYRLSENEFVVTFRANSSTRPAAPVRCFSSSV